MIHTVKILIFLLDNIKNTDFSTNWKILPKVPYKFVFYPFFHISEFDCKLIIKIQI